MSKNKANKFSPEVRERAVRLVQEHRGAEKWGRIYLPEWTAKPGTGKQGQTTLVYDNNDPQKAWATRRQLRAPHP